MVKRRSWRPAKLPSKQLAILAICRFAEPVAMTSVFPYLPEMMESFGIDRANVAKWAGITSAVFSISQCLTAVIWGRASDRFGRKPAVLTALSLAMVSSLIWGMSTTLPMAIVARAMSGGCNGNGTVGIIRTMVAEMVPEKELQPRAFSIMPLVWTIGSIFGPSFGGFFAKPAEHLPALFGNSTFFQKFPFALPNIVASILFTIGITTGVLFLRETLEAKRHRPDPGLYLGSRLIVAFKTLFCFNHNPKPKHHRRLSAASHHEQSSSLLRPTSSGSIAKFHDQSFATKSSSKPKPVLPRPTYAEVFTRQSVINLTAYTFLALHTSAYDQLLPVFLHHPRQTPDSENTTLPFKFSGGFGLSSSRIGTLFTMYGFIGCFIQFLVFPPVARKLGVLYCFKVCGVLYPIIFFLTPYTALIANPNTQQATMFVIMVLKSFTGIFAFPCSVILLTNSASSLRILGTLNGFAVSISAIGRAIGPAIGGVTFTWGLKIGYIITSWWLLGIIAAGGAIPIWYLVEMDGFSKTESDSDEEEEEEEEDLVPRGEDEDGILEGDEVLINEDEEVLDVVDGPPLNSVRSRKSIDDYGGWVGADGRSRGGFDVGTFPQARRVSFSEDTGRIINGEWAGDAEQREQRERAKIERLERRMSSPIGIRGGSVGPGGGRRLSNGFAASNSGHGTGGHVLLS